MKKVLYASTALILTGGMALADVTISGSGRFGLSYNERPSGDPRAETTINTRLRFNIDASTETDSGVTFGGRIRLQYDNGDGDLVTAPGTGGTTGEAGAELSAAKLFASFGGMTLEVGNVDTAYDSAALMYASEIGFIGESFGNPGGDFYSFSSGPFSAAEVDRMGIAVTYSIENFNARLSWVTANQSGATRDNRQFLIDPVTAAVTVNPDFGVLSDVPVDEELSISLDYTFGQFVVSAAAVNDGAGIAGNDQYFLGGEYKLNDTTQFGLLYFDNGDTNGSAAGEVGETFTLYGAYGFGATTVRGYIANNNAAGNEDDVAFGIGADYDLGGATLAGGIESGYNDDSRANLGVKFNF